MLNKLFRYFTEEKEKNLEYPGQNTRFPDHHHHHHHEDKNTHTNLKFGCSVRFEVLTAVLLKIQVFREASCKFPEEWNLQILHLSFTHFRKCSDPYKLLFQAMKYLKRLQKEEFPFV